MLSDMLFSSTHSVEQLVNIKKKKQVDKVLLKVIRTVRSKGNLDGWVKPEAHFKNDLKLSDKVIASILKSLSEYYGLNMTGNKRLMSAKAIVVYIKTNKPKVSDSIFLVDASDLEEDTNNEVDADGAEQEITPNIEEAPESPKPVETESPEPDNQPPTATPEEQPAPVVVGGPQNNLEPTEPKDPEEPEDKPAEPLPNEESEVSTEALNILPKKKKSLSDVMDAL